MKPNEKMNILLADNGQVYFRILQSALHDEKVNLVLVKSIDEAVAAVAHERFHFFIVAWQLQDGEGIELTRRLRGQCGVLFEPIVLFTASPSTELADIASRAGATELFRKQDVEELITFMQRFLKIHTPIPCRVLYVEDARDQRQYLHSHMLEWGMEVDAYDSADEAWQALSEQRYDLIICDIVLSGQMSGSRFINRIRRQPAPLGNTLILAATAFDTPARRIELFHLGIDDYIVKPIIPLELKARIQNLLLRKRYEDELVSARRRADDASLAKSAFLASMSHEIRTPLNAITGMAQLIRRGGLAPRQEEQLDKLETAGQHLLGIINDILDISKIEAGKLTLEETQVDIEPLLNNVVSILRTQAEARHLRLLIECPPFAIGLLGDPTRLQQALLNYATNAVKFSEHGEIFLRVSIAAEEEQALLLRFEVEDTGIGIAETALPHLFTAFHQAEQSTTRKYGGTGLGLAITRSLALQMGGEVGVRSSVGVGSTFWFTARLAKSHLPCGLSRPALSDHPEDRLRRQHAGQRVLLVEDEPINAEIAQMILEEVGLQVERAENGQEAVDQVKRGPYAAILMDMQMPVMDGLEATQRIRQLPRGRDVAIIAMTANAFAEDKARCLAAGMNDFISKPFNLEQLYSRLLANLPQSTSKEVSATII